MKFIINGHSRITVLLIQMVVLFTACKKEQKEIVTSSDERPNIILIMSDDMGYSDIAPYGGEIETHL